MGLLKECPNCNEMLGNNASVCFKCKYDFDLERVPTLEDMKVAEEQKNKEKLVKNLRIRQEEQQKQLKLQQDSEANEKKMEIIKKNGTYEYITVQIYDLSNGAPNIVEINNTLSRYAMDNWRLHTALTNEIGKDSNSAGFGGMSSGTNATVEVTILIFERCLKTQTM